MDRRHLWLGLQATVTVVLLVTLFHSFDWARFADVLRHMSAAFYFGSLLAVVVGQMLYALRWQVVLGGMGVAVSYAEVLRQYLIGLFFSQLMPTSIGGDAAKVYYLGRRAGYVQIGASVFLDRFLGLVWLAVLGAVLAWTVGADSPLLALNRKILTTCALAFVATIIVVRVVPTESLLARIVPSRWGSVTGRVGEFITLVRGGATRPATVVAAAAVVFGYSWLITVVYQQYFLANALPAVPVLKLLLVVVSMAIFVNVPLTINGIGLREQLHVLLFTGMGIPREAAVWISLLLFSHFVVLSLIGWGLWLKVGPAPAASVI